MPFPGYRPVRLPLDCQIWYRGGPEGEVRILARGWEFVIPGVISAIELVHFLNGQMEGEPA